MHSEERETLDDALLDIFSVYAKSYMVEEKVMALEEASEKWEKMEEVFEAIDDYMDGEHCPLCSWAVHKVWDLEEDGHYDKEPCDVCPLGDCNQDDSLFEEIVQAVAEVRRKAGALASRLRDLAEEEEIREEEERTRKKTRKSSRKKGC